MRPGQALRWAGVLWGTLAQAQEPPPPAPPAASATAPAERPLTFPLGQTGFLCAEPRYPVAALRAEAQGRTAMRFAITEAGELADVQLLRSAGDTRAHALLDRAALAMLKTCRYRGEGAPKAGTFSQEYVWVIR